MEANSAESTTKSTSNSSFSILDANFFDVAHRTGLINEMGSSALTVAILCNTNHVSKCFTSRPSSVFHNLNYI